MAGGGAAINSVTFTPLKTIFTVNPSEYEDAGSVTINCSEAPDVGVYVGNISSSDTSIAEAILDTSSRTVSGNNVVTGFRVKPNSAGTATLTAAAYDYVNLRNVTGTLEITVTAPAPADDQNFLNERGLAHFWDNIDSAKQDKLTAGAGISITNDVISATGGGVADSVAWGHITGSMSSQTDLTTALAAKANSADLATVATSGDYDDLTDKPTIGNATLTIQKNGTSAGTFTANATSNKTINITVPTTAADVSALPASTKYGASIAVSINTTDYKVTTTLKDQDGNTLGTAQVIDLPLESVVVNGSYDNTNKKIVLTLQNGNTIDIPVADLVAGLQSEITSTNKLASDLVDDANQAHKFMTSAEKTKLSGIATGAEVNVQSDWDQTTTTADDYIKNKPSLATVATSGSYNDLSDKPTIPAAQVNSDWNATSGVAQILNKPSLATVATSGSYNDLIDKPADFKLVEMSYGESNAWAKFIAAYNAGSIVYCRASSNANPATGSQTRKAFMAYVNNADNPTSVEFQYVRSVSSKTASQPVDQVYVYTLTSSNGGTWSVTTRDMGPKLVQGTNTTVSYSNGTYTISATQPTVPTVVQTTGQSTTDVMSQKAVTDIIGNVETILQTLNNGGGAQ